MYRAGHPTPNRKIVPHVLVLASPMLWLGSDRAPWGSVQATSRNVARGAVGGQREQENRAGGAVREPRHRGRQDGGGAARRLGGDARRGRALVRGHDEPGVL